MQPDVINSSPSWISLVYSAIAGGLGVGVIVKLIDSYVFRRNRAANAEKTAAEARRINLQTDIEVSQSVVRTTVKITQMQDTINQLQLKLGQREIELEMAQRDIKKLKGLLDVHGISFSEFDGPKQ